MRVPPLPINDVVALACFLICWLGYGAIAKWQSTRRPSLISTVNIFRARWMRRICQRESHIADATLLGNLLRGALFFASTTVFILGGLIALLGPTMGDVISRLPYSTPAEPWLLEVKALTLIAVFVYAFFKFTWSAWQYNVVSIIVGASPRAADTDATEVAHYVESAAHIAGLAGDSYNKGIRAYYFAIPLLAWFVDPLMFLGVTLVVTLVLYRREFSSPMLDSLRRVAPDGL
ncbi:DUF599 domain-containing protein [Hyphomicrobium sp.]|uniref:DUF599 domain-containing protein n=1 Tax=Hyphomicrobium sp. TaxID=82 RepID=UPI002E331B7D|nr:DUF599 domain-containing protein [Hyphomicrobium sp.]HEX2840363.1 DUF599 domain-containing protein [Hyphomicrobium sp.]